MKNMTKIFMMIIIIMAAASYLIAQDSTATNNAKKNQKAVFIDNNGDGYNDNAPDHDGDGIPNGLDPDWIKLKKEQKKNHNKRFIDLDGDGIDDNLQKGRQNGQKAGSELNESSAGAMGEGIKQQKGQKKQYQKGRK